MSENKSKSVLFFENLWYHYKAVIIIIAVVLAAALYFGVQTARRIDADYDIAVISPYGLRDEELSRLADEVTARGTDLNGDGEVKTGFRLYRIDFTGEIIPDVDYEQVGGLDANLVGKVSGIYLTDQPSEFIEATGMASTPVSVSDIPVFSGVPGSYYAIINPEHPFVADYEKLLSDTAG